MKRIIGFLPVCMILTMVLASCKDTETYADLKENERNAVRKFVAEEGIQVISVEEFLKDTITNNPVTGPDFSRNEYVLFEDQGVYMQIIRRGQGSVLEPSSSKNYNVRYFEYDILHSDTLTHNRYQTAPDVFTCSRSSDLYTSSFVSGIMFSSYGSSVPKGWMTAMPYITPGFLNGEPSAKVRLIVPHTCGTQKSLTDVYPCLYELTITHQKWQ
ncbi:MAG: DUF4827 domain-containing protein [Bacteroidaceae bacterium]|nr:DUF4827 domain-containing protein [Bacteroidaceae bacterium]